MFTKDEDAIILLAFFAIAILIMLGMDSVISSESEKLSSHIENTIIQKYSSYEDIVNDYNGKYYIFVTEYPSGKEVSVRKSDIAPNFKYFITKNLSYHRIFTSRYY